MRLFSFFLCVVLLAVSGSAIASTAWINDHVVVPLRSGAGTQYRIINSGLTSNTRLTLLDYSSDWSKVRYQGETGYVQSQYLSKTPTAAIRLNALQQKYTKLKERQAKLKAELEKTSNQRDALQQKQSSLKDQLSSSKQSLSNLKKVAANPIQISKTNKQLSKKLSMLQTKLDQLRVKNGLLEHDKTYTGWAFGLGTIILGMILGAWIKSRGKRNRGGWA